MKKAKQILVSFGMAMVMMVNLSAVSYAAQLPQLPLSLMIGQTAPVSMEQSQYSLQLSQAQVKHTEAIAQLLLCRSRPKNWRTWTNCAFSPGTSSISRLSIK